MLGAMTPTAPSSAREAPASLTLLTGGEQFLLSRAVARVVAAARAIDPEVQRREVDAQERDAEGALLTALSPSLFGGSAVVVVSGLADAGPGLMAALVAGLGDLPADTWVVALHSGARNKRGLAELRALDVAGGSVEVSCAEVKRGRPTRDLLVLEAKRCGRRLTVDGAEALVVAVGSDVALLVAALEQLAADAPDGAIDAAVVNAAFSGVAEVSGFQLADAVWERRSRLALQRLRWGMAGQTVSGAGAVGSLAAGLRAMVKVRGTQRGMPEAEVARLTGVPPFKIRALRLAAGQWEPGHLADAVVALAAVDAQVKGGLRPGESLEPTQKARALEAFVIGTGGVAHPPRARRSSGPDLDLASGGGRPVS